MAGDTISVEASRQLTEVMPFFILENSLHSSEKKLVLTCPLGREELRVTQ